MGNHIVYKGVLLDERDFGEARHPSMETLSATIHDYLRDEFEFEFEDEDDSGLPELEMIGVASERLGATHMFDPGLLTRSCWVEEGGSFHSALLKGFDYLGLPDPETLLKAENGAIESLEQHLRREVCDRVMAGDYNQADRLLSAVANLREAGLPQIHMQCAFDRGGDDDLYDFRQTNHGPGSRILAEIGFNWGQ